MSDRKHPPRMMLKQNKDGLMEAVSLSFVFMPFPQGAHEYLSLREHQAILEKAVGEARAKAFHEAAQAVAHEGFQQLADIIRAKSAPKPAQKEGM